MTKPTKQQKPVVVTTAHRGVFVGLLEASTVDTVTMTNAHMVVYYSAGTRSVMGLASKGPQRGSKVSPAVARIVLRNVTAVIDATPEAQAQWESEPWG